MATFVLRIFSIQVAFCFLTLLGSFSAQAIIYKDLAETGLYLDSTMTEVSSVNLPYSPQYPLWTDGAIKKRWIYLPAGTQIDTSDMNLWKFPVGTKIWKEFAFKQPSGQILRVETRLMEKLSDTNWQFLAFAWSSDQSSAPVAPDRGLPGFYRIDSQTTFDIPSRAACIACHGQYTDSKRSDLVVQSFAALQLSAVRDPLAPHADQDLAGMVNLSDLAEKKLISTLPAKDPEIPNDPKQPFQKTVFGYLHGNCASCHRPGGLASETGLFFNHQIGNLDPRLEPAYQTAVGKQTKGYMIPGYSFAQSFNIFPGRPTQSAILYRLQHKDLMPMPPFGTKLVDDDAVAIIQRYIQDLGN